ncbi:Ankyrin repeat [Ostreococcus tauri]|uniref:Ankyrin repeat n=1 Tax=Ostreococcus tauri TaxID=70448 RepID=A0A090M8B7_OSTTA|nr:Ankyrin repeat [Ostreococcus tauri]CEG01398.1 Ankyrin repeat [Ostreococcus tauri]|eukprot:XP_022840934.1 Ankyrin repeat [Ostreococcus tauri]
MGIDDHDTFSGLTQLHKAAAEGDLKKVIECLDSGADISIRACGESNAGKTAAMFAASGGHVDVLKAMQRGSSLLDLQSADGGTPAMSAAAHSYGDVLQYLIEKKVNLNAQDEDGWTALMYAVCAGNVNNVARLVAAGADTKIKNNDGETAIQLADGKHKEKLLEALGGKLAPINEGKKKGCCVM